MDSLLAQVQTLALQADTAERHKILDLLRSLQLKLETPHDTLSRFSGMVSESVNPNVRHALLAKAKL